MSIFELKNSFKVRSRVLVLKLGAIYPVWRCYKKPALNVALDVAMDESRIRLGKKGTLKGIYKGQYKIHKNDVKCLHMNCSTDQGCGMRDRYCQEVHQKI